MDKIHINNLEIFAKHGVLPEENVLGQKFIISATLFTQIRQAGLTDNLDLSTDYSLICRTITEFLTANTFKLIETAAERLAERILLDFQSVKSVRLELKKPWAPVAAHLDAVSVEIERSRHTAFIALGSNMGDRTAFLNSAIDSLANDNFCRVVRVSSFLNTSPYGFVEQADFLNACLELDTLHTPLELLSLLHAIENAAGRERSIRWGPRTLDLDILLYDNIIMSEPNLRIPHPEMHKRSFVLSPLCEIASHILHPVFLKSIAELDSDIS